MQKQKNAQENATSDSCSLEDKVAVTREVDILLMLLQGLGVLLLLLWRISPCQSVKRGESE